MNIALCGGGTAGSVTPLLALWDELHIDQPRHSFLFVGTRSGFPEREMVSECHIPFTTLISGKFRRYLSLQTAVAPFLVAVGFIQAVVIFMRFQPDVIIAAGGYVSVPCVWAGWLLGKKIVFHQPDVKPGLSLAMSHYCCTKITTGFQATVDRIPGAKAIWTGNPTRVYARQGSKDLPSFPENLPLLLITGGGTGSLFMNKVLGGSLPHILERMNVTAITGKNKSPGFTANKRLRQFEFLKPRQLYQALATATIVVSRAGASILSELSDLRKASILVPLPHSPQEDNAALFSASHAAVVISQEEFSSSRLSREIDRLLQSPDDRAGLERAIARFSKPGSGKMIASIIRSLGSV